MLCWILPLAAQKPLLMETSCSLPLTQRPHLPGSWCPSRRQRRCSYPKWKFLFAHLLLFLECIHISISSHALEVSQGVPEDSPRLGWHRGFGKIDDQAPMGGFHFSWLLTAVGISRSPLSQHHPQVVRKPVPSTSYQQFYRRRLGVTQPRSAQAGAKVFLIGTTRPFQSQE